MWATCGYTRPSCTPATTSGDPGQRAAQEGGTLAPFAPLSTRPPSPPGGRVGKNRGALCALPLAALSAARDDDAGPTRSIHQRQRRLTLDKGRRSTRHDANRRTPAGLLGNHHAPLSRGAIRASSTSSIASPAVTAPLSTCASTPSTASMAPGIFKSGRSVTYGPGGQPRDRSTPRIESRISELQTLGSHETQVLFQQAHAAKLASSGGLPRDRSE